MKSLFFARSSTAEPPTSRPVQTFNYVIVFFFLALIFFFSFNQLNYHWDWGSIYKYRQKFLQGWLTTVLVSSVALGLSTFIGLCSALAKRTRFLPLRYLSMVYTESVRGTPLLVQILIVFYVIAPAFHVDDRYLVGVLILSLFSGAYISEIIRAGIESVGASQIESAKAIGLTRAQTYRYVILPQALRQTLPPLAGQFVSLIKDSSLLSIIGLNEFTQNAREVNSYTFSSLESYIPLAVGYLILTLPISLWTRHLEQRVRFET